MQTRSLRSTFVPAEVASSPRKLLVVLHGRGDSAAGFAWMPRAFGIGGLDYLLVDAPDPYYDGYSWYDLAPRQGPGIERSRARLQSLFGEIAEAGYAFEDVGLFGFSQGCLMTLEFGGRFESPLAAYVGVSGYCWQPQALLCELSRAAKRPEWLVTHGRQDEVVDFDTTSAQVDELITGGLPLQFTAYEKGHTIDPDLELPALRRFIADRLS